MTLNTIYDALELLERNKKLKMNCISCKITRESDNILCGFNTVRGVYTDFNVYHRPKMEFTIQILKDDPRMRAEIDYYVWMTDLEENSIVDNFIDNIHYRTRAKEETKQTIRLAWIIWNGYNYAVEHIMKKDYVDLDWHPRVLAYRESMW